jgi:hypothetical protein
MCFGHLLCPSSGVFHCTHSNVICHTVLLTACEQEQMLLLTSCQQTCRLWHIPSLCVQWKTPDDGKRNYMKHVEFHSKNKLEKLMHLVGYIIWNLTQCTLTWTSNKKKAFPLVTIFYWNSKLNINHHHHHYHHRHLALDWLKVIVIHNVIVTVFRAGFQIKCKPVFQQCIY